jgi:hypothetical protein
VSEEDAWVKTFSVDAWHDWRLTSKAMGAGIVPQLGGVWLGKAWQPSEYVLDFPLDDEAFDIAFEETLSPQGWAGRTAPARGRRGTLHVTFPSEADYDLVRYQVLGLYARGFPAWLCLLRDQRPERTLLVRCPAGALAFARTGGILRTLDIPFVEEQPAP